MKETEAERHVPVRTCAGCGRRAPKAELLRFVACDGALTRAEPGAQGRGVDTGRRLSCFERAAARRAFARTLKASVRVDPALKGLYTSTNG